MYVHCSYVCLSDQFGNNIDSGVPVDFVIEVGENGPVPTNLDYSKFFDPTITGTYLPTAYSE